MKRLFLFSFICAVALGFAAASLAQAPAPQVPPPPAPANSQPQIPPPVQNPGQAQPPAPSADPMNAAAADSEMPVFQNPEGYHYDPAGRRDPFKPYGEIQPIPQEKPGAPDQPAVPPEPLQAFDVSQFKLLGIIWQVKDPKAIVIDPSGRTHLLRKQTKIGRNSGFVAAISEGEVIVVEPAIGESGVQTAVTRTLTLK